MSGRDDLAGKVAVVTGATAGSAVRSSRGWRAPAPTSSCSGAIRQASIACARSCASHDVAVDTARADLSEPESIQRAADAAWAFRQRIDLVINAAGVIRRSTIEETSLTDWDEAFAVNARGSFLLTRHLGPHLAAGDGGAVVSVSSLAGDVVTGAPIAYGASKAALIYITKYFAVRWAPKVRVNSVSPGYVRTNLNEEWLREETNLQYVIDRTPMERVAVPDDIVGAALFLSSPAAAYVTGQNLVIDGGWSAQ